MGPCAPLNQGVTLDLDAEQARWSQSPDEISGDVWYGSTVIGTPPFLGHHGNGRRASGRPWRPTRNWRSSLRSPGRYVFGGPAATDAGARRFPYFGRWIDGTKVANRGPSQVLIVEWERGTDSWRETLIEPGHSMVVDLSNETVTIGPDNHSGSWDCALIESNDDDDRFRVTLSGAVLQCLPISNREGQGLVLAPCDRGLVATINGPYEDFETRIDGGEWQVVGGSTHEFTQLSNGQTYLVEARIRAQTWRGHAVLAGPVVSTQGIPGSRQPRFRR